MSGLPQWRSDYFSRFLAHLRMPLYRNGYALAFSAVSSAMLGFLYWALAARYYTTEAVGLNAAAIAAMTFLASVARLYLDGVLIRFLPRAGVKAGRLIRYAYFISGMTAAAIGVLFILGLNFWAPALGFLRTSPALAVGFILGTIAYCIFDQQDGALTGLRQAKWVPLENTLFALAKLVLLVMLAKPLPDYGMFFSWMIPVLVSLVPVNLLIFRKLLPRHMRESGEPEAGIGVLQIVQYAGGHYTGYLFLTASLRLLPLIVLQVAGSSAAAFFTLPWMIVTSLRLVTLGMMGSLTVEASRDKTKLVKYSRRALAQTARLLIPVVVFLLIAAPYLLQLFGQSYASEATLLLRLLSLATLPQIVTGLYLSVARVQRWIRGAIAVQASLCVMVLSLSYLFLAEFGITGIGVAWLISQTIVALVLFFTQLRPLLWTAGDLSRADSLDRGELI